LHNILNCILYKDELVRGKSHVNGIESFWSFAKRRLAQFNGLREEMFYLHLKESEFRFNNRHNDIYAILLKNITLKFTKPKVLFALFMPLLKAQIPYFETLCYLCDSWHKQYCQSIFILY